MTNHVIIKTGSHSYAQGEVIADEWVTLYGYTTKRGWDLTERRYPGLTTHTMRVPASWIKSIGEGE